MLCKLRTNSLIALDVNLVLYLSVHSPLRTAASAVQTSHSRIFHPAPSVQGPGSPPAPLSSINKLLIRGDILFFSIWVCQCPSVSMCELQKAPVMDTWRQPKPMGIEGTGGIFVFLLLVSLCLDNCDPRGEEEEPADIRALGRPRRTLPFTLLPDMMDYFSPAPSAKHLSPVQWKACMYIFRFNIRRSSIP